MDSKTAILSMCLFVTSSVANESYSDQAWPRCLAGVTEKMTATPPLVTAKLHEILFKRGVILPKILEV